MRFPRRSLTAIALVATAGSGVTQEEPRVEVLLDGVVDESLPAVVRVPGATRVRGARGPWSLPVRPGSTEFLLPSSPLPGTALSVEIAGRVVQVRPTWRVIARPAALVVDGADALEPGAATVVRVAATGLPSVAAPYAVFDSLPVARGLPAEVELALARARSGEDPSARALDPVRWPADFEPFRAAVAESRRGPALPPDVVTLLILLGALQLALTGWALWRRPDRRVLFVALAAPGVATLAWLISAERVDGRIRARAACYAADDVATIVLHVSAATDVELRLRPPPFAGVAHPLRYDVDDTSWRDADVGYEVRVALGAGESRLLAYRVFAPSPEPANDSPAPREVTRWLADLGLRPTGQTFSVPSAWLPTVDGHPVVAAPGRRVEPGK